MHSEFTKAANCIAEKNVCEQELEIAGIFIVNSFDIKDG